MKYQVISIQNGSIYSYAIPGTTRAQSILEDPGRSHVSNRSEPSMRLSQGPR